jgi:uncharacterized protein
VTRKRKAGLAALALLALLVFDLSRPPSAQASARVLLGVIDLYQATFSRVNRNVGVRCRFTPTCSHYGEGAIRKYGALKGTGKAAWRILRCGPWTERGTVDPP